MKKTLAALLLGVAILAGCSTAQMHEAMTPSMRLAKDDFDGAVIVQQPPVSAASSISEGFHTLGLEWNEKTPDIVYVTAGVTGIAAVTAVAFNADGRVIDNLKDASATTQFEGQGYGSRSSRRFAMTWPDFLAVAHAKSVKMRVSGINDYTVSSFGPEHPNAIVNVKFGPFVDKVRELRGRP